MRLTLGPTTSFESQILSHLYSSFSASMHSALHLALCFYYES